ncbi:MAG: molybdopterin molybdotransferase MoeA [Chitinophagaceae bacterium]|nr:molybdopterin molybdotransferase MoeA [Chitinophagaceae bacterium]
MNQEMISVQEAKQLILQNSANTNIAEVTLQEANGCRLAETIYAPSDTPPFDQSAMDGYAFSFDSWDRKSALIISGEVRAGSISPEIAQSGYAIRIFTGAPMPPGTDTVVIQEKIIVKDNTIIVTDEKLAKGSNVRLRGSQTKEGEAAMQAGHLITAAGISFLTGIGINTVKIFSKPTVSIIVTGTELVMPGEQTGEGKIVESNSPGLVAALRQIHISPAAVIKVDDDEAEIVKAIRNQLQQDIIILTGGISEGDYDFVASALQACGVKKIFHKVKQKPGKPFYFGSIKKTSVFALPGNPAAVLTCFYEYIVPAISHYTKLDYFKKLMLPLTGDYQKRKGLTYFLKGKTRDDAVSVLNNQESYKMNSFALADCLVELDEEKEFYKKGDRVSVNMIL